MAEGLEQQKQQYQEEFRQFINRIEAGTFEGDLDKMVKGHEELSSTLKKQINNQIQSYQKSSPNQSIPGFVKFIGKKTANSLLGPVNLSWQDFANPQELLDKAKSTALQNIGHNLAGHVTNPAVEIINRIKNKDRRRDNKITTHLRGGNAYGDRVNERRILSDENYEPEDYEKYMENVYPERRKHIKIIQDNFGNTFYNTRKNILNQENDDEITGRINEYLIKFHITNDDEVLIFRMANFAGFTDSVSVTYNEKRYFGRPELLKQYDSVSRDVSFSFDVVIEEESDIYPIYKKLDILTGLCYPNSYTNDNIIQPNVLRLSVGNYFNKVPFFPTTIAYTMDEEMVFANGKPRMLNVSVNGGIIQPERNPKLNKYNNYNSFVNTTELRPNRYKKSSNFVDETGGPSAVNVSGVDNSQQDNLA